MKPATQLRIAAIGAVLTLSVTACGQAPEVTATPSSPSRTTPFPNRTPSPASTASPPPAAGGAAPTYQAEFPSYDPAFAKKLLAEQFVLPGMLYGAGEDPQPGGSVTISVRADLGQADPMVSGDTPVSQMFNPVTGGNLVRVKPSDVTEHEARLAESWTSDDSFKVWTFKLRRDVKWHDGSTFDAHDFVFWLNLAANPPPGRKLGTVSRTNFLSPSEIMAVDQFTVRLVYREPQPFLLESLKNAGGVTHKKSLAEPLIAQGKVQVNMPDVGWLSVGPFKVDRWDKESSFRLVRFDQYYEKDGQGRALPYLDGITFVVFRDINVAVSAMRAGRLDSTSHGTGNFLSPDMVGNIKRSLGNRAWFYRFPDLHWGAAFNATKPPFNDLKLRKALNLYADRQEQIQLVYGGYGILTALMHPGSYWHNPDFINWPGYSAAAKKQDQAEAVRIVKELGIAGTEVSILCKYAYVQNCEFLDISLRGLGLTPKINIQDNVAYNELSQSGQTQIMINSFSPQLPNELLVGLITTNPLNLSKHGDTKVDEYHQRILSTLDPAERRKVTWEAEYYVAIEKAYAQPYSTQDAVIGYRTYVKGVWVATSRVGQSMSPDHKFTWIDKSLR